MSVTPPAFRWTKHTHRSSQKLPDGCELYRLNVGDLWGGTVESKPCEHEGGVYWEAWYTVCGKQVSGQSGGGAGRDECMAMVERYISEAVAGLAAATSGSGRKIFSSVCEIDKATGEVVQQEVE